ncbi:MAG: glycosyltransferase family 2 protein [Proteobacteria bacterium]|nr:glycosyltransferase family 2 protein [Pseudomonadota bacterium]MBW3616983.1 glycosyltransferase family 2 protein [Pseudomonadota bacterium]
MALVQVIVVAWNSGAHLQRCMDALAAQTVTDWEAVVWDNASTDGAVDRLRLPPNTEVVRSALNLGFAAANNRAAERSESRWIAALNPDAFPEPDWLEQLLATAERHKAEAAASLQLDDADPSILDGAGDSMSIFGIGWRGGYGYPRTTAPTEEAEVFSPCAAAALYRRDVWRELEGFDERFFAYFEDVDLGFRIRLRGGRTVFSPRAVVRHVGSASSRTVSGFAERHGARNRLWTFARDMPLLLMPLALPLHLAATAFVLVRSPDAVSRQARLAGLGEGLRGLRPFLAERRRWRSKRPLAIARALAWSPQAVRRRRPVTRSLS